MIEINLHPYQEKGKKTRREGGGLRDRLPDLSDIGGLDALRDDPWQAAMVASIAVSVLAILSLWFIQQSRESDLEARLEQARADSARLADLRSLTDSLNQRRAELKDRIEFVRNLDRDRFVWPHLLDELSSALPEHAWLTRIARTSPQPDLRLLLEGMAPSPMTITQFIRALQRSPYIAEVRFQGSQRDEGPEGPAHSFNLMVRYGAPPAGMVPTEPLAAAGS